MLHDVKQLYQNLNNKLHVKLGQRMTLQDRLSNAQKRVIELEKQIDNLTKASLFLQTLSDTTRQQTIDKISTIVTDALQKVKDPNLEFKMLLTTERNQLDVKFVVLDKVTKHEYDILNSCGGSIADIVTFPLRTSLLLKWEPKLARILVLDEAFKYVSIQDQNSLGGFVKQLSEKLNLQIILVSHSEKIAAQAHKIFLVTKTDQQSIVEESHHE